MSTAQQRRHKRAAAQAEARALHKHFRLSTSRDKYGEWLSETITGVQESLDDLGLHGYVAMAGFPNGDCAEEIVVRGPNGKVHRMPDDGWEKEKMPVGLLNSLTSFFMSMWEEAQADPMVFMVCELTKQIQAKRPMVERV